MKRLAVKSEEEAVRLLKRALTRAKSCPEGRNFIKSGCLPVYAIPQVLGMDIDLSWLGRFLLRAARRQLVTTFVSREFGRVRRYYGIKNEEVLKR